MLKLSFVCRLFAALSDGKRQAIAKKYGMDEEQVVQCSEWDPTKNSAYTDWICREFKAGRADAGVKEVLAQFDRVKQSPQFTGAKNIFDWQAPALAAQFQKKWREQQKDMSKGDIQTKLINEGLPGAKLILNSGPWKIWRVVKPEYAVILGSKTHWCTTQLGTATHYCSRGPLYPIWKNGKPWAQGHVGERGLEFHNQKNENVVLNEETLDLIERAKDIPQIQVLFDAGLRDSEITPGMEKEIEKFILDTDNFHMLQTYLKSVFWEDGWELVLDVGQKEVIEQILQDMKDSAKVKFSASPIFTEILVDIPQIKLPANMLSELIGLGRIEDFVKGSSRIWLVPVNQGGLRKELADKVRAYLLERIAATDPKDKPGVKALTDLFNKVGFGKTDYKKIVLPYWQKFFVEGRKKPKELPFILHYEMLQIPEYAKAFAVEGEDAPPVSKIPRLKYGDRVKFVLTDGQYADFSVQDSYLSSGSGNRWIFDRLHQDALDFCSKTYGYAARDGIWPPAHDGDMAALTRCVQQLRSMCARVEVNRKVY